MDFKLTRRKEAMREMAKNFAEKKIAPTMEEDEKSISSRKEIVKEMARLDFSDVLAPEKYGGNESGVLRRRGMTEEVARVSPSWRSLLTSNEFYSVRASQFWNEEQREKYLPN